MQGSGTASPVSSLPAIEFEDRALEDLKSLQTVLVSIPLTEGKKSPTKRLFNQSEAIN